MVKQESTQIIDISIHLWDNYILTLTCTEIYNYALPLQGQ